ncbi:MAG TPA: carboxypeptidase regulatory-like domain-containing protein [Gemmatimonadaceae bacterium]|jgi:hypothetical protein
MRASSKTVAQLALLVLTLGPATAWAQQLRGVVRDSAGRTPIPGVVLLLSDTSGRVIARTITSEDGGYAIGLTPSIQRIRVLRIGFRPRELAIPEMVDGIARLDVSMAAIPTLLAGVNVIDQPNCPRRTDRPAAFALWEQTKAALLATVVAREAAPATVLRLEYDRRMDPEADTAAQIEVSIDSASATNPFVASRPAAEFVALGFVDQKQDVNSYHAPDADVMLDDAFPQGYCFEIASVDPTRPGQIGLGFKPAKRRGGRIDIEGAVWIDTSTRALTDIVFRYVGLDAKFDRSRPGGTISFRMMPNGSMLVDRWFIRMLEGVRSSTGSFTQAPIAGRSEVHEKGGEIAHARWADGREWNASLGTVEGRAFYGTNPAAHTRLRLLGTDYRVTTDSDGTFKIPHILPGPHTLGVEDSVMAELGIALRTGAVFTAVRDSTIHLTVATPTADDYVATACASLRLAAGRYSVIGRVLNPDGSGAGGAPYEVRKFVGNAFTPTLSGRANEHGVFVLCDVNLNDMLLVSVRDDGNEASITRDVTHRIETMTLRLTPRR